MNDPADKYNGGPYPPATEQQIAEWAAKERARIAALPCLCGWHYAVCPRHEARK